MKVFRNKRIAAAVMAVAIFCLGLGALAWPAGQRKWRVEVIPASYAGDISIVAGAAGEIAWVRWNNLIAKTNDVTASVVLVNGADGWQTILGTLELTNAATVAAAHMETITNTVQWRIGDKLLITNSAANSTTNGTLAIGYWYYD